MTRTRPSAALVCAALVVLAGCGGGGKTAASAPPPTTPSVTSTTPQTASPTQTTTAPATNTAPAVTAPTPTSTAPATQPGGNGGTAPIAAQALFTGKGGTIGPGTVRVPPFIAVRVVLRSADGRSYAVRVGSRELAVGGSSRTASLQLAGLRAGHRYNVDVVGAPEALSIVANAEPGP